jgi:hypothetical protein
LAEYDLAAAKEREREREREKLREDSLVSPCVMSNDSDEYDVYEK